MGISSRVIVTTIGGGGATGSAVESGDGSTARFLNCVGTRAGRDD